MWHFPWLAVNKVNWHLRFFRCKGIWEGLILTIYYFIIIIFLLFLLFDRRASVIADMELTFNRTVGENEVDALISEAIKSDGKLGNIDAIRGVVGSTLEGEIILLESYRPSSNL